MSAGTTPNTQHTKPSLNWLEAGGALGIWCNLPDIHVAETVARSGADWLCFDLQHGLMDFSDLLNLMPAVTGTGVIVLVRVAANQPDQIGKALDIGAHGVIVPMVNSAEEAARAAAACRYPPAGERSCGPMRPALLEGFSYLATANDKVMCFPMIETGQGVAALAEIAAVPGVDGLFVGPMDLCYGLGLAPGDFANEKFSNAVAAILAACKDNGKPAGMFGYDAALARASLEQGFSFASIGSDISFVRAGLTSAMATARGEEAQSGKPAGY